jgi:fatty-acyl-CoA synthase
MQSTMMNAPLSLNHLLERAGRLFAGNEIVSRRPDKSLVRHSYGAFYRRTRALASALQGLGLRKGDRVATLCWNHHAHLECYFGIPAAGGVMHTLNLRLAPEEIGWIAGDAQDRFLVIDDVLLPLYEQFKHRHAFEQVIVFPFGRPAGARGPAGLRGAAGRRRPGRPGLHPARRERPGGHVLHQRHHRPAQGGGVFAPLHRAAFAGGQPAGLCGVHGSDVVLPVTPMFHANSWGMPYMAVMMGAKLVFPGPHMHPDDLLDLMTAEPPTLALGVPTIWMTLIQTYDASLKPGSANAGRWKLPTGLRSLVGGAAVPEALIRAFDAHGIWIMQGWGMTETSPVATVSYPRAELQGASADEKYRRAAMAGVPVPLVELRARGDDGRDQPWDGHSVGEIQVRGPFITGSYHQVGSPADKFTDDGWLRTGDVASVDALGFVKISDRTKDLIKSGGEWISSVDLENALMAHPAVAEAAVVAIPDAKWGERPLACVVLKPGEQATPEALDALLLAKSFARWQLPERYEFIDAVPRTSTGKFWKPSCAKDFRTGAARCFQIL